MFIDDLLFSGLGRSRDCYLVVMIDTLFIVEGLLAYL